MALLIGLHHALSAINWETSMAKFKIQQALISWSSICREESLSWEKGQAKFKGSRGADKIRPLGADVVVKENVIVHVRARKVLNLSICHLWRNSHICMQLSITKFIVLTKARLNDHGALWRAYHAALFSPSICYFSFYFFRAAKQPFLITWISWWPQYV